MSSMLRSTTIQVGSRTYTLASVDDDTFNTTLQQKGVVDVECIKSFVDYDDQVVLVRNRLQKDHKRELMLHELLHVCIEDSGMNDEHVERIVAALAPRLVQIIDHIAVIIDEST